MDDLIPLALLGRAVADALKDARWRELSATLISGGKSNLTFALRSDAGELILRRPPTGELLPSAHDMAREARVLKALAPTPVPVPRIVLADDGTAFGIACYVMEKVAGHVVRGELPAHYAASAEDRHRMAFNFVDALATIHDVDQDAVGLANYGHPGGYMARQVSRWLGQWEASRTHPVKEIDELGRRLTRRIPVQQRSTVVHGDYRLDNVLFAAEDPGRINAVLDWELSTLGDPLADVGLLMLYWRGADDAVISLIPGVTHLPGFPSRDALLERYAASAGVDLSDIAYYQAFAHFKFAVIAQGVAARSAAGAMGGQDFGNLDEEIVVLGRAGLEYLR